MNKKQLLKEIDEWMFSECPTEEKKPFFWRWTKKGEEQLVEYIIELLKAEHFRGFVEGSDATGTQAVEIHACELHDQRKKYRAKIKTLKDANSEDNMISLEARLQKNDAYNECIKIIK